MSFTSDTRKCYGHKGTARKCLGQKCLGHKCPSHVGGIALD